MLPGTIRLLTTATCCAAAEKVVYVKDLAYDSDEVLFLQDWFHLAEEKEFYWGIFGANPPVPKTREVLRAVTLTAMVMILTSPACLQVWDASAFPYDSTLINGRGWYRSKFGEAPPLEARPAGIRIVRG